MSNKRITELVPINSAEINDSDLLAIADISVPETKKMTMGDLADYVAYSASLTTINSASYSNTASFLLYRGMGPDANGTASFAISASWALLAYSASFVISASHAVSSSYSLTCSYFDGTLGSGSFTAENANTASYLLYNGYDNGTSSYSISGSRALWSNTSSYVSQLGAGIDNGTVFRSISSSYSGTASVLVGIGTSISATASWANNSKTASFLAYSGISNGTASYALNAQTALGSVTSSYLYLDPVTLYPNGTASYAMLVQSYLDYGPYTASISNGNTASFFFVVSGQNLPGTNSLVEFDGDITTHFTGSSVSQFEMFLTSSSPAINNSMFVGGNKKSRLGMLVNPGTSGSITRDFMLKGSTCIPSGSSKAYTVFLQITGSHFDTTDRAVSVWIRSKYQNITLS